MRETWLIAQPPPKPGVRIRPAIKLFHDKDHIPAASALEKGGNPAEIVARMNITGFQKLVDQILAGRWDVW
jgi:hypothetical protein